jgi:hypothetical protein
MPDDLKSPAFWFTVLCMLAGLAAIVLAFMS